MVFLILHPLLKLLHNLGGVRCQPSLKCSGYYVADLTPLKLADSLECFLSLLVLYFSSNFNSEDLAWLSSLQTLLTNLNLHIAKHFSVICDLFAVPFHSLVYQTLYHFKLRGMKEFSN